MKTTLDLQDGLLQRAKLLSKRTGRPLRSLVEEGLRRVLDAKPPPPFELPDVSAGRASGPNPLEGMSWQDLRDEIYGTQGKP